MAERIVCRRRRHMYRNSYKPMVFTAVQGRRDRVSYTKDDRVPSRFPRSVWRAVLSLHREHTHIMYNILYILYLLYIYRVIHCVPL